MRALLLIDSSALLDLDYSYITGTLAIAIKPKAKYPLRKVSAAKLAVKLTPLQLEVLTGTALGDSHIERAKPSHNARVRFEQSFPAHASYLMLLYGIFSDLTLSSPSLVLRKPDRRTGLVYPSIYFRSMTLPCLNALHELFYPNGIKVVPINIAELLTARALAFWIMDDGSKKSYGQTILHTDSFTLPDVVLLQSALHENFGLRTRLILKRPGQ